MSNWICDTVATFTALINIWSQLHLHFLWIVHLNRYRYKDLKPKTSKYCYKLHMQWIIYLNATTTSYTYKEQIHFTVSLLPSKRILGPNLFMRSIQQHCPTEFIMFSILDIIIRPWGYHAIHQCISAHAVKRAVNSTINHQFNSSCNTNIHHVHSHHI